MATEVVVVVCVCGEGGGEGEKRGEERGGGFLTCDLTTMSVHDR